MSRTPTPEHEAWLAANGMYCMDPKFGHWAEPCSRRCDGGFRDMYHTERRTWMATYYPVSVASPIWEGPEFDAPEVAWVHAELNNWGQP